MTPIEFSTGKLNVDQSAWMANDNTEIHATSGSGSARTQINIEDPDIPTKYFGNNEVYSEHNQFINFDATSARKDVRTNLISCLKALKRLNMLRTAFENSMLRFYFLIVEAANQDSP